MKITTQNNKSFNLKFDLFKHQIDTFKFIEKNNKCFIFNEPGTGKTEPIITNICYNILSKDFKKVLIVSTLTTLKKVWYDTFSNHNLLDIANPIIINGDKEDKEKILKENKHITYIINPDGISNLIDLLLKIKFDYIIIDEATTFKIASSQKSKDMLKLIKKSDPKYLILATGTPIPNKPLDGHGLLKLMYPKEYSSKINFRMLVETQIKDFIWIPKKDYKETLSKLLQPSIYYKKSDVLKEIQEEAIHFEKFNLSDEQSKYFKEMAKEFVVELDSGVKIESVSAGVKRLKLMQILGGSLKNDEQSFRFNVDNKLKVIENIIVNKTVNKAIIFCNFKEHIDIVLDYFKDKYRCAVITGDVNLKERNKIFTGFQDNNTIDLLIAIPKCMAHGITLTVADSIIYYTPTDNETYLQANARINRPGQLEVPKIWHVYGNEYDKSKFNDNLSKTSDQNELLILTRLLS